MTKALSMVTEKHIWLGSERWTKNALLMNFVSNGLAERHVGLMLQSTRAVLLQGNLPMTYWDYAVHHVAWCKNMVPHSMTKTSPYELAMGHKSPDLYHVRPFGCRMLCHPVTDRLPTFQPRLKEGVCLGHISGGIYKVCLLYTSPSPRDQRGSRMPSSA